MVWRIQAGQLSSSRGKPSQFLSQTTGPVEGEFMPLGRNFDFLNLDVIRGLMVSVAGG
jgi:hypothetical protein